MFVISFLGRDFMRRRPHTMRIEFKVLRNRIGQAKPIESVADPCPPVHILSISCSFLNVWQNRMLAPPWRVGAPTSGKSWIRHY